MGRKESNQTNKQKSLGILNFFFEYRSSSWDVLIGHIISIRKVLRANRNVSGKLGMKLAIHVAFDIGTPTDIAALLGCLCMLL